MRTSHVWTLTTALAMPACFSSEDTTDVADGSSSEETTGDGDGGTTGDGDGDTTGDGDGDTTGDGDGDIVSACDSAYADWFEATFSMPDGNVVGPADFPESPWGTLEGAPAVANGTLVASGASTLIASQGDALPKSGLRVRFTVSFADQQNEVMVGVNGDVGGQPTLAVSLSASDGAFTVTDGNATLDQATLGALELDTVFHVELELDGTDGRAWLSTGNYATVPGSTLLASLELEAASAVDQGKYTVAHLEPSNGASPQVDDIVVSRCGPQPPAYDDVFIDDFEDNDLAGIVHPPDSTWNPWTADVYVLGGAVRITGFSLGIRAPAERAIGNEDARLRALVRFGGANAWPSVIWATQGEPMPADDVLGFILWNNDQEGRIILEGYTGGIETPFPNNPYLADTNYYVQISVDGPFAVATVRTESFTGPIHSATVTNDVGMVPEGLDEVGVQSIGGDQVYVDEMRLSQYVTGL